MSRKKHNEEVLSKAELGDRIEFVRGNYSHWGIYAGEGDVIHMSGIGNETMQSGSGHFFTISGKMFDKAEVRMDDFWDVVETSLAYINNRKDKENIPYPGRSIVERAKNKLGKIKYSLLFQNCEHFVNWCRYDVVTSDQVTEFLKGVAIAAGALGVAAGAAGVLANKSKKTSQNQQKQ